MIHAVPPAAQAGAAATMVRESTIGRTVLGRPIRLTRVGPPDAPVRVLVVGSVHGNEPGGRAVARALRRAPAPPGARVWIVWDLNPDGAAAGTRQNARGVDLNRNFPVGWRAGGRPFDTFHPGQRPLSEPESRAIARLVRRVRPDVSVWYHQALRVVDPGTAADPALARRYARVAKLPTGAIGRLPGTATRWQNRRPGSSAFVVELAAGPPGAAAVGRHLRAVRAVSTAVVGRIRPT